MASGFKVSGIDLDSIFAARAGSTARANVGFKVAGTDIADRYYATTGGDLISSNTGYKSGGTDLKDMFRDLGYGVAPNITVHPNTTTLNEGSNLTLTVSASGGSLTYQWKKGGADVSGATSSSLSFTPISRTDAATYTVAVTNAFGTTTSNGAVITVQYAPAITGNPSSATKVNGQSVSFTVTITNGVPSATYQWQKGSSNISNGAKYSGVTTATLSFTTEMSDHATDYRCVVSNSVGSATSSSAVLTVTEVPDAVITGQPSGFTVNAGTGPHAVQCFCAAHPDGTLKFAWTKNGGAFIASRNGNMSATSDQHVFNPILSSDAATYRCQVTSVPASPNTVLSSNASVVVNIAHPTVTTNPASFTGTDGNGPYAIFAGASGGVGGLIFAWYQDGILRSGPRSGNIDANNDQHVFSPLVFANAGGWICQVTTPYGGVANTSAATVTVDP